MAASTSSEDEEQESLAQRALATAVLPVHFLTSRPAIKAYLSTLLFLLTSVSLLAISTTAFLFFYYAYIPQVDLSHVIYLQYGTPGQPHPHAHTQLETSALTSNQPYDISIDLYLPRTPSNLAAGNFMLDLGLLSPPSSPASVPSAFTNVALNTTSTLAQSRRPAILPYTSPILSLSQTLTSLPLNFLGFRDPDAITLHIPMFERVVFARGWRNVPAAINLEVQSQPHSDMPLQIYSAKILFQARFQGPRWFIYNYRLLSWTIFSAVFYTITLTSMAFAWLIVSTFIFPTKGRDSLRIKSESDTVQQLNGHAKADSSASKAQRIKEEKEADTRSDSEVDKHLDTTLSNLSDTPTTFPTLSRQMPLRFPLPGQASDSARTGTNIKHETQIPDVEQGSLLQSSNTELLAQPTAEDAADDELDEEEEPIGRGRSRDDRPFDSGIGTSMESENVMTGSGLQRRRSSRTLKEKD